MPANEIYNPHIRSRPISEGSYNSKFSRLQNSPTSDVAIAQAWETTLWLSDCYQPFITPDPKTVHLKEEQIPQTFTNHPELTRLTIENSHFDIRHELEAYPNISYDQWHERVKVNFFTAFYENTFRQGSYLLQLYQRHDGEKYISTPDFRNQSLVELAQKGINARKEQALPTMRQEAELLGLQRLEQMLINASDGDIFILIYPEGQKIDGYNGSSLTYIYQAIDTSEGRTIKSHYYQNRLSFAGHSHFWQTLNHSQIPIPNEVFFASSPFKLESPTKIEDIFSLITELEKDQTLIRNDISLESLLPQKAIDKIRSQLNYSANFLTSVIQTYLEFRSYTNTFSQIDIDTIEIAYTFAWNAVSANLKNQQNIKSFQDLWQDFKDFLRIKFQSQNTWQRLQHIFGLKNKIFNLDYLTTFQNYLLTNYDQARQVGGSGCPSGLLADLSFSFASSGPFFGSENISLGSVESQTWTWHIGNCRCCKRQNVEVGPCDVCRNCQTKFDRGELA